MLYGNWFRLVNNFPYVVSWLISEGAFVFHGLKETFSDTVVWSYGFWDDLGTIFSTLSCRSWHTPPVACAKSQSQMRQTLSKEIRMLCGMHWLDMRSFKAISLAGNDRVSNTCFYDEWNLLRDVAGCGESSFAKYSPKCPSRLFPSAAKRLTQKYQFAERGKLWAH